MFCNMHVQYVHVQVVLSGKCNNISSKQGHNTLIHDLVKGNVNHTCPIDADIKGGSQSAPPCELVLALTIWRHCDVHVGTHVCNHALFSACQDGYFPTDCDMSDEAGFEITKIFCVALLLICSVCLLYIITLKFYDVFLS